MNISSIVIQTKSLHVKEIIKACEESDFCDGNIKTTCKRDRIPKPSLWSEQRIVLDLQRTK